MTLLFQPRLAVALVATSALSAPLAAGTAIDTDTPPAISQLAPAADTTDQRLDYSYWDEALEWFVLPMGPSIREGAPRVQANTGTRRIYGHDSRYRLEGNRVAFSFMDDGIRKGITAYRQDLERIGSEMDVTRWPRNEQLAFWINLHNVAVIEALAYEYPLGDPTERSFGSNQTGLQDAHLVTIKGTQLSPRDIREKIVYPNWKDPKVIYGFWRGEIGGPSLQRLAFNGQNLDLLLSLSAEEFVNSLRGVERYSGALQVSKIYEEAQPFYFQSSSALKSHLNQYAREDVKQLIEESDATNFKSYDTDLADLTRGTKDPGLTQFGALVDLVGTNPDGTFRSYSSANANIINPNSPYDSAIQRLINERADKLNKAIRRGIRSGTVTLNDADADQTGGKEVL